MKIKSRNISNAMWSMADTIIYPVVFLGLTPFFLSHLGEKLFGVYMLSTSILVSLQVFNLGVGTATLRNVARFHRAGNNERINETINTNISFSLILLGITAILGVVVAMLVRYAGLFNIENGLKQYTAICIVIATITGGLKFCEQVIQFSFKGFERFDVAAGFNMTVRLGGLIINAVMVYFGQSVMSMLLVTMLITFALLLVQIRGLKWIFPYFVFGFELARHRIVEELNFGVWIWLQSLVIIITFQTDRYIVTYIGLETLSYYGLTATIFNHIQMMISSMVPWLFPRIAGMKERNEDILPLYKTVQTLIVSFGTISLICFFIVRQPILTLWVGNEKFMKLDQYIPLFTGFTLFSVLTIVPMVFLNASGFEKLSFRINALMAALTIGAILIAYYLTHSAQGVIMGLIAGTALYIPFMQYALYTVTGGKHFVREVILTILPSGFALLFILSTGSYQRVIYFLLILITLKLIYFTKDNFDLKWLK